MDAQLNASGFHKKHPSEMNKEMEGYLINLRGEKAEVYTSDEEENYSDSDYEQYSDDSAESSEYYSSDDSEQSESDDENERIIEALSSGVENLKMDKMGNYILE